MTFFILIQILDVWVNLQLWWDEHVKKMLNKMKTQINVLIHIMTFTWEVMLTTARQIYNVMIRLAMTHDAVTWHLGSDAGVERAAWWDYKNSSIKKLAKMQNKCLWIIVRIYKVTLIIILKTETHIFLLNLYLNIRLVSFW